MTLNNHSVLYFEALFLHCEETECMVVNWIFVVQCKGESCEHSNETVRPISGGRFLD